MPHLVIVVVVVIEILLSLVYKKAIEYVCDVVVVVQLKTITMVEAYVQLI